MSNYCLNTDDDEEIEKKNKMVILRIKQGKREKELYYRHWL